MYAVCWLWFKRSPVCQAQFCLVPALVVIFSLLSMRQISWLRTFLVKRIPLFYKALCCRLFFSQLHPVFSGGAYSILIFKEALVLSLVRFARARNFVVLLAFILTCATSFGAFSCKTHADTFHLAFYSS